MTRAEIGTCHLNVSTHKVACLHNFKLGISSRIYILNYVKIILILMQLICIILLIS